MRPRGPKQYCLSLDIALWCKNQIEHSIWDESLLFCNCACSLEYSSLNTLTGLSYHICRKLEVAFKASPSSQHQHCTDEAQVVYLTLFRQVVWNVLNRCTISFADMAFGRSVVLHFPQEIQKNLGISEVAPQLLRALDAEKIDAVEFLKSGRVRVTCKTAEYRDDLLSSSGTSQFRLPLLTRISVSSSFAIFHSKSPTTMRSPCSSVLVLFTP